MSTFVFGAAVVVVGDAASASSPPPEQLAEREPRATSDTSTTTRRSSSTARASAASARAGGTCGVHRRRQGRRPALVDSGTEAANIMVAMALEEDGRAPHEAGRGARPRGAHRVLRRPARSRRWTTSRPRTRCGSAARCARCASCPRAGAAALEVTVSDGRGSVIGVFLGPAQDRRAVAGPQASCSRASSPRDGKRYLVYNPVYELAELTRLRRGSALSRRSGSGGRRLRSRG